MSLLIACLATATHLVAAPPEGDTTSRAVVDVPALGRYFAADDILVSLPAASLLGVERVDAFEDHEHFAYVSGTSSAVVRRLVFLRPGVIIIDEQLIAHSTDEEALLREDVIPRVEEGMHVRVVSLLPGSTRQGESGGNHTDGPRRSVRMVGFSRDGEPPLPACSVQREGTSVRLEAVENGGATGGRTIRLRLPAGPVSGRIEVIGGDGRALVANRPLPAGILSPDIEAVQRRLQWDLPYRAGTETVWDTGHASTELKRMVEGGQIKPCRAVEIGCGTGSDAIYLASRGFDVTAVDIAPTALGLAERKAERAGVHVNWLLADVLNLPTLEPFDCVYDRGCYHGVRQHDPQAYVATVKSLTHARSKILILAGNANKDTYWRFEGPPRVTERDIRSDFAKGFQLLQLREFRFDPARGQEQGALAWSILLERGE